MRSHIVALLVAAFCLCAVQAQSNSNRKDPIHFMSKAKDNCTLLISSQGEQTKLRVSCKSLKRSYGCEYLGRPSSCRAYTKKQRHYFTQIMWELRKLPHACQGPNLLKPLMCKKDADKNHMTLAKFWPKSSKTAGEKTTVKTTFVTVPQPTEISTDKAAQLAQEYCWETLQGVCSYLIRWFQD